MKFASKLFGVGGLAVLLSGCGAGGSTDVAIVATAPQFIVWAGSAGGSHVIDGLGHSFAFYQDTGCLYNAQTGRENSAFCLASSTNVVAYGPFRGVVQNIVAADGTCQAAIVDQFSGYFADIEVDAYGREVIFSTLLVPVYCRGLFAPTRN